MNWLKKIILIIAGLAVSQTVWAQSNFIEYWGRETFNKIQSVSHLPNVYIRFDYGYDIATQADHSGLITINVNDLQAVIRDAPGHEIDVIKLIVGHEMAHEIEYYFEKTDQQVSRVKECQADLLTGMFWALITYQDATNDQNHQSIDSQTFFRNSDKMKDFSDVLAKSCELFFKLGDDYSVENMHPRNEQRLTAIRTGFNFGAITGILNQTDRVTTPELRKILIQMSSGMYNVLDYRQTDNFVYWSLREARAITHSPVAVNRNVVMFSYVKKVDSTRREGYFQYQHRIKNIGNEPVNILFYDQVFAAPQDSLTDSRHWQYTNMAKYEKTLQPGVVMYISGKLKYVLNKYQPDLLPIFVKPDDPHGMYYCTQPRMNDIPETRYNYAFQSPVHEPPMSDFLDNLFSIRDRFFDYTEGIGRCPKNDLNIAYYPCKIAVPGARETLIVHDNISKSVALEINLYEGDNQARARDALTNIEASLLQFDSGITYERVAGISGLAYWDVFDTRHQKVGRIMLKENPAGHIFNTVFTIFSV